MGGAEIFCCEGTRLRGSADHTGAVRLLYCGGGFRSALVADNLQKMGYTNVISLDGGWRGWNERGLPVVKPEAE